MMRYTHYHMIFSNQLRPPHPGARRSHMINQIDMIDPSIKCGAERLYRQALEIRVENPQLPIGHTK